MNELKLKRIKKTFQKEGETVEYFQYSLVCNGTIIAIKAVYENDKAALKTLYGLLADKQNNYKEDYNQ